MTPIEHLSAIFGTKKRFADEIGISKSLLRKWQTRSSATRRAGHVPSRYNQRVMQAARELGIPLRKVRAHLDRHICPLCERALPAGKTITPQVMQKMVDGG